MRQRSDVNPAELRPSGEQATMLPPDPCSKAPKKAFADRALLFAKLLFAK